MKDGAPPNFETEQGTTLLMAVAYAGRPTPCACSSAWQGREPPDRNGRTLLMAAAAGGNVRCVIELLRAEANLGAMDNESKTVKYARRRPCSTSPSS